MFLEKKPLEAKIQKRKKRENWSLEETDLLLSALENEADTWGCTNFYQRIRVKYFGDNHRRGSEDIRAKVRNIAKKLQSKAQKPEEIGYYWYIR